MQVIYQSNVQHQPIDNDIIFIHNTNENMENCLLINLV